MLHGDIEKPLDGIGVEVQAHHAMRSRRLEQVGNQFGRDGFAGQRLLLLAGIAVVGQNGGDAPRTGAAQGVYGGEQHHEIGVYGRAGGLDQIGVTTAYALIEANIIFAVRKLAVVHLTDRKAEPFGDGLGEGGIARPGENLHFVHARFDLVQNVVPSRLFFCRRLFPAPCS